MSRKLTTKSEWTFNSHIELTAFIIKFDAIQPIFFPNNSIETSIIINDGNTNYRANLVNKAPSLKGVGEIDNNESRIGSYDSASFMRQIESNQKPDHNSYMRRTKKIK